LLPQKKACAPIPARSSHRFRITFSAAVACIFFFCAGLALLPHVGIEDDESLFAQAIFRPRGEIYSIHIGRSHIPLLLMTYLGALKSLILRPVLMVFGTGIYALRTPMLLAGALSVWLFFLLLRRVAGDRAALIGCALLAVDSSYLVTVCFDWGPVALQHLFIVGGALLVIRFFQQLEIAALAGAFFLFGLALWDKALAIWILSGMGIAAISTYPRQILDALTPRRAAVAVLCFTLGALPLLAYNSHHQWVTFQGNFQLDIKDVPGKARFLLYSENGALFGWLTAENWRTPKPHAPEGTLQTTSARISAMAGEPKSYPLFYAFVLALFLTPWVGKNNLRIIGFSLIAMTIAWLQMGINFSTGATLHHTILLWPFPELVIAVSFAAASRRLARAGIPAIATAMALLLISGALVINQYYLEMIRYGGGQAWTGAIFRLSDYVRSLPAQRIVCLDWGIMDQLRLLSRGKLPLEMASDSIAQPEMPPGDRSAAAQLIADPQAVFIAHTKPYEFFPGNTWMTQFGVAAGYDRQVLAVIEDGYGRPVYEIFRFTGRSSSSPW
jgi:hypothetical protein